jgi:hypothetical protein
MEAKGLKVQGHPRLHRQTWPPPPKKKRKKEEIKNLKIKAEQTKWKMQNKTKSNIFLTNKKKYTFQAEGVFQVVETCLALWVKSRCYQKKKEICAFRKWRLKKQIRKNNYSHQRWDEDTHVGVHKLDCVLSPWLFTKCIVSLFSMSFYNLNCNCPQIFISCLICHVLKTDLLR